MGITALPATAVRVIGSTQCLTDPVSLVKELIENSLDAKATSIHIEIASNTLDKVKIRDNGHGIAPEDRALICKRHYTSKIGTLEDLHVLGGQFLGFRGEALASALELSSRILVSTRIEGEQTGVEIGFGGDGLVESQRRLSHPVGTTIEIDNFLSNVPVRRQMTVKNSSRYLLGMKTVLRGYALARPVIRVSFKVLKAKSNKSDWNYAPRAELANEASFKSLILDAAIRIFGTKPAEALLYQARIWTSTREVSGISSSTVSDQNTISGEQYIMECLMVDPEHMSHMPSGGFGQYISIDSRPISCDRGTLKQISSHYKSYLRSAAAQIGISNKSDPLLVMNLKCPKGSYDVNVEPTKDDVLFYDAEFVLQNVKSLFSKVYGDHQSGLGDQHPRKNTKNNDQIDILLAKKPSVEVTSRSRDSSPLDHIEPQSTEFDPPFSQDRSKSSADMRIMEVSHRTSLDEASSRSNISLGDEDEMNFLVTRRENWNGSMRYKEDDDLEPYRPMPECPQEKQWEEENEDLHNIRISNPWTFAKLNRPFRTPFEDKGNETENISHNRFQTPQRQNDHFAGTLAASSETPSQSPCTSTPFFPYPQRAYGKRPNDESSTSPTSVSKVRNEGALDSWFQRSKINEVQDKNALENCHTFVNTSKWNPTQESTTTLPERGLTLQDIPNISQRPRGNKSSHKPQTKYASKPLTSPVNDPERVWFDVAETPKSRKKQQRPPRGAVQSSPINVRDTNEDIIRSPRDISSPVHPDLALALDYETRKTKATQDHRENLRREKLADIARQQAEGVGQRTIDSLFAQYPTRPLPNSPHKNRQVKAVAALRSKAVTATDDLTDRKKLNLKILPLERVKKEYWVSDQVLPLSTTLGAIESQTKGAVEWDDFVSYGEVSNELEDAEVEIFRKWETQLRYLIGGQYRKEHAEDAGGIEEGGISFYFHKESVTQQS